MIAYIMPMLTNFQDYYTLGGEERRRIERMMSRGGTGGGIVRTFGGEVNHTTECVTDLFCFEWRFL